VSALDVEALKAFFGETKVTCSNCKGEAYVTGVDRSRGKWTCYGCGLVNRFEASPPVEEKPTQEA
jgi:hypothetical protein